MKYASLPVANFRVLDTVKDDIIALGKQLQFHATLNVMPGFMLFSRSSNTPPGLTPTRLSGMDMNDETWYTDRVLSVGMTPYC